MTRGDVSKEIDVVIPSIDDAQATVIAEEELAQSEVLTAEATLPREFHPRAIKEKYRLKAILWSVLLAVVMVSGMIGDRSKWGSMVNNVLRMMSGQATETAGIPDMPDTPETTPAIPNEQLPNPETTATPESTLTVDRLIYPAKNLIDDETLCRNSAGAYRAVVEPIEVDGLKLFRITVVPTDKNGEANISDLMLPVLDPSERIYDAAKCLAGMPNGEGAMTYYIPASSSEKASERDTSELKIVDINRIYMYFPDLVIVDEKGEQQMSDTGAGIFTFKNPDGTYTNTALSDLLVP